MCNTYAAIGKSGRIGIPRPPSSMASGRRARDRRSSRYPHANGSRILHAGKRRSDDCLARRAAQPRRRRDHSDDLAHARAVAVRPPRCAMGISAQATVAARRGRPELPRLANDWRCVSPRANPIAVGALAPRQAPAPSAPRRSRRHRGRGPERRLRLRCPRRRLSRSRRRCASGPPCPRRLPVATPAPPSPPVEGDLSSFIAAGGACARRPGAFGVGG
jgi:hypothetical protein